MKIGVLSDIHGEFDALQKALALFRQRQVETVICAGDLVDRGSDGDKVVDLIRELNIPCVQGNHDAMARKTQAFLSRHLNDGLPIEPLRTDTVDFLSTLPLDLRFEWTHVTIYMTHENPLHDPSKFIYPTTSQALFETVARTAQAQIVILGHTHRPMHVQVGNVQIINPGSVYANHGPYEQTCGILDLPDGTFEFLDVETGQLLPITTLLR